MVPRTPALLQRTVCALLAFVSIATSALCEAPIPRIESHVVDLVGLLPPGNASELERRLSAFEKEKGSQLVLVVIPTTEGEPIEQFGIRLAESRPAGRKGIDDGAFLIIASADRRMRIEVGYGLEGALNDATCKRIISDIITPHFRAGNYAAGIEQGLVAMMAVVSGEELPKPPPGTDKDSALGILGFLAFLVVFVAEALAGLIGRLPAALLVSGGSFLLGLFFTSLMTSAIIAAAFFLFVIFNTAGWSSYGGPGGRYYRGGRYGGGSYGGRGGGFRLGGGGFGGGGASGSW